MMNKIAILLLIITALTSTLMANEPDSAYIFSYATTENSGRNGLHLAWSHDAVEWHNIGNRYSFVKSDYGNWGGQKRMVDPYMIRTDNGTWFCVWSVNESHNTFAWTKTENLMSWKPQDYPLLKTANCQRPVISFNNSDNTFTLTYISNEKYYSITTSDFKTFSETKEVQSSDYKTNTITKEMPEGNVSGQMFKVSWNEVDALIKFCGYKQYKNELANERTDKDGERFANLKPITATITAKPDMAKPISDMLIGIFFEDINYAADGGIYAELVQNRDFEYNVADTKGRNKEWNSLYAWNLAGEGATLGIDTTAPIHSNNKHYAVVNISNIGASIANSGFDGITIRNNEIYDVSLFVKQEEGKGGKIEIKLVTDDKTVLASKTITATSSKWEKKSVALTASADADNARLEITPKYIGKTTFDMVSLFPRNTFNGRKNGLRADLATTLADIKPRFIRFPGGCVAHGDGIENIYRWKNSIGPLEARVPMRNIWSYHQTLGLGFYEYFQFCEDIKAEPLPVIAAGVPCQNSAVGGAGQQGGIPIDEMDSYIQDILDLIEWANGDGKKTKWGKIRAESGHPEPFNLKYIGIGNEDLISDVFAERYSMICKAVKSKYPDIKIIGTVGPFFEGSDYETGWKLADELNLDMVDEHYYQTPGWYIYNQDFYDRYDRSKSKVYLGEYAAHLPRRPNNLETALAEALYLTSVERNGDVVAMSSYAPLLAKEKHTQWNPDLIYFNNKEVKPTVGYHVQKLYGNNSGNEYISSSIKLSDNNEKVTNRIARSFVRDSITGDIIIKLVNMLPVEVASKIELQNLVSDNTTATATIMTGNPADRNILPQTSDIKIDETFDYKMPAYSFSVIRISNTRP